MNTRPIRFFYRGSLVNASGMHTTRSVLDWLREDARCTGTKEGCNEGDCGACTVVVGELPEHCDSPGEAVRGLRLRTVNACTQFLPTLHGKALYTVEDLKLQGRTAGAGGALHPVQQALVDCHGSQCGFCTPGFVMSLWWAYETHQATGTRPSRQQLADALAGNLCRCTGYRPILDAGQCMFDLPKVSLDTAPAVAALRRVESSSCFHYTALNPHVDEDRLDHFYAPRTLAELAELREKLPAARLLAGATDIGLWVNKQFKDLGDIIYVGAVDELKHIKELGGELRIGAGVSLEVAWGALARHFQELSEVWLRFGSPPVRHAGTLGGNLANGSPIGDGAPVLMALGACLELRRGTQVRRVPLDEFYLGYMKTQLQTGEWLQTVVVPLPLKARQVRAYKISKRFDSDISALCAGLAIELDAAGAVTSARLAFGGMAETVSRAPQAEAAVMSRPWTQDSVQAAQQALAQDFKPLSDLRAGAAYRLQVAQNLLMRFWLETRVVDPLPAEATRVWSQR